MEREPGTDVYNTAISGQAIVAMMENMACINKIRDILDSDASNRSKLRKIELSLPKDE